MLDAVGEQDPLEIFRDLHHDVLLISHVTDLAVVIRITDVEDVDVGDP